MVNKKKVKKDKNKIGKLNREKFYEKSSLIFHFKMLFLKRGEK